jgi:hypothetical protein
MEHIATPIFTNDDQAANRKPLAHMKRDGPTWCRDLNGRSDSPHTLGNIGVENILYATSIPTFLVDEVKPSPTVAKSFSATPCGSAGTAAKENMRIIGTAFILAPFFANRWPQALTCKN